MIAQPYPQIGYARPRATAEFLKISIVTLWRWEKSKPNFPKSIRLSERVTVYDAAELRAWLDNQKNN